ncbi:hypothetical protein AYI68_g655 [Smittium mucronatum]|uniref:PB1 domain-containing protein n=1 Tax=Smittium mucronatum TaxID=133383 RepID=A0A1R0H7P6_9FUNG|nr:hypothetical protein AYI68_g5894 [Smittium mucronatum]OLY85159.1 hypothetical protein AYI68_g655 [Smittium mucronatum]
MAPIVIKFIYKGPEYYRYYWDDTEKLKWKTLIDGVRLLFGITSDKVTLVYKDDDGENVLVTNQFDLTFMISSAKLLPSIKVRVIIGTVPQIMNTSTPQKEEANDAIPEIKFPIPFDTSEDSSKKNQASEKHDHEHNHSGNLESKHGRKKSHSLSQMEANSVYSNSPRISENQSQNPDSSNLRFPMPKPSTSESKADAH